VNRLKRLIVLLALAFIVALVPAVPAQPNKPLRSDISIVLDLDLFQWNGTITGIIEGNFTIFPDPDPSFPGILEHYVETWVIETDEGTIELIQKGVWSFKTFKFKSNGWVTAATGTWAYLFGSNAHVRGVTTEFPAEEITGEGKMWICGFGGSE